MDPLQYLNHVGADRVLIDKILEAADRLRQERLKVFAEAVGIEVGRTLAKIFR